MTAQPLLFQLTRPLWGVTAVLLALYCAGIISTHTPLVGRDIKEVLQAAKDAISTHTPLVGRVQHCPAYGGVLPDFNSHAPCGA